MDMDAMGNDVRAFLEKIPPDLLKTVAGVIFENMGLFTTVLVPEFVEKILPHIKAGGLESASGLLEKDEIENTLKSVFGEVMMSIAAASRGTVTIDEDNVTVTAKDE